MYFIRPLNETIARALLTHPQNSIEINLNLLWRFQDQDIDLNTWFYLLCIEWKLRIKNAYFQEDIAFGHGYTFKTS